MENKAYAFFAGFFTLSLLIATILGAIWLNTDRVKRTPYEIATQLSIPGLSAQADVRYRGLVTGKVDHIRFDPNTPGQILITISVNPHTPMTHSTYGTLAYQGVTGIAYIQLDDDGSHPEQLVSTPAHPARLRLHPSLFDTLQSKGVALLHEAEGLINHFNHLLAPENQRTMLSAFEAVGKAAQQVGEIPQSLQPTLKKLPIMTDELQEIFRAMKQLSRNMSTLSHDLNDMIKDLQSGAITEFTNTMKNINYITRQVEIEILPDIQAFTTEGKTTLRTLNHTMDTLRRQPKQFFFGRKPGGPGEPGFAGP